MAQRGSQELIILLSGLAVAAMCFSGVIVGGGLTPVAHVSRQTLERLPVRSRVTMLDGVNATAPLATAATPIATNRTGGVNCDDKPGPRCVRECSPCFLAGDNTSAWDSACQSCVECLPYKSCPVPNAPLAAPATKPELLTIELRLDGSVESFLAPIMNTANGEHFTKVDTLRAEVANKTGVPVGSIDISVRAGSLIVDITLPTAAANQLLGDIDAKKLTALASAQILAIESRGTAPVAPNFCTAADLSTLGQFAAASDDQKAAMAASLSPGCIACLSAPNTNAAKCMGGPTPPQCDDRHDNCPCSVGDMKTIVRTHSVDSSAQSPEQAKLQQAVLLQTLPPQCMRCVVADSVSPKDEKCFGLAFGSTACASSEAQACLGRCAACANPHTAQALSMCGEPDCVQCAPLASCLGLPASDAPMALAAEKSTNTAIKSAEAAIAGAISEAKAAVPSGGSAARPVVASTVLVLLLAVCRPLAQAVN